MYHFALRALLYNLLNPIQADYANIQILKYPNKLYIVNS